MVTPDIIIVKNVVTYKIYIQEYALALVLISIAPCMLSEPTVNTKLDLNRPHKNMHIISLHQGIISMVTEREAKVMIYLLYYCM